MTSYLAEISPVVAVPPGVTTKLRFGDNLIDGGTADAVSLIADPWHPGMEVSMNPRLGIPEYLARNPRSLA